MDYVRNLSYDEWNTMLKERDERIEKLNSALMAILADPTGCVFCDSGRIRTVGREHDPKCGYALALQCVTYAPTVHRVPMVQTVHIDSNEQRADIPTVGPDTCPKCKVPVEIGFGLAGGGYGPYTFCPQCSTILSKTQEDA